jgi:two-component system, NtrC family, sensor histidine kinase HydH
MRPVLSKDTMNTYIKAGIITALVLIITVLHFLTGTDRMYLHQIYQRSYYIPIILACFWFEIRGGLITTIVLSSLYLVHIRHDWMHHPDYSFQQYAEIAMYLVVSILGGYLSQVQRKTREQLELAGAQLKTAYQKLNETFDQLRHSDRLASLGQLSAGIAHEIRNPLGSIQGAVDILAQDLAPEDPKFEFAHIARKEVSRLERLTSEILQYSKPAPPRQLPINWREIVEAACRLCSDEARHHGVEIGMPAGLKEAMILVDPEQIKQVVINILINAIQAQPNGGAITIEGRREAAELVVSIQDRGTGMTPEQLDRIYDPFFTTRREGTGLGLSISFQLVSNNGGRLWATSEPGQGACFHIGFPVH